MLDKINLCVSLLLEKECGEVLSLSLLIQYSSSTYLHDDVAEMNMK